MFESLNLAGKTPGGRIPSSLLVPSQHTNERCAGSSASQSDQAILIIDRGLLKERKKSAFQEYHEPTLSFHSKELYTAYQDLKSGFFSLPKETRIAV